MENENAWTIRKNSREDKEREREREKREEKKGKDGERRTLVWRTVRRVGGEGEGEQDDSVLGHASLSGKLLIP